MSNQSQSTTTSPSPGSSFAESQLYHDWYNRVATGPPNDYIIAISAHPGWTGVSGSGKTTFGLDMAKNWLDWSEGGFDAETQATLDPSVLKSDVYDETGELGVMIYDEAQGTPSTTGLNAKRAMKDESLNAINTIATRRKDRKTLILITQSLKSLVKDLYQFIDAWLLIVDDVNYRARHYRVQPDVFDLETRKTKTPGVEQLSWSRVPESDDDYQEMDRMKDNAIEGASGEDRADSSLPKDQQAELAQEYRNAGKSARWVADNVDAIEFEYTWVLDHTENPDTNAPQQPQ